MVVESNSILGGCASISGGGVGLGGGNALQIKAGIFETADMVYNDLTQHVIYYSNVATETLAGTPVRATPGSKNDPRLVRVFADRSLDTFNWLVAHGAQFSGASAGTGVYANASGTRAGLSTVPAVVDPTGVGKTNPANIYPGAGWTNPLVSTLQKLSNVDIEVNTKMTQIIREGAPVNSGRVLGIAAEVAGQTVYFRANKAVILATGGWKGHPWLRTLFDPRLEQYPTLIGSGEPFCYDDGTGMLAALNAGAVLTADRNVDEHVWHRQWGTLYHVQTVAAIGTSYAHPGFTVSNMADIIFVNKNGNRFVDETFPETTGWFGNENTGSGTGWVPPYSFYDIALVQGMLGPYGTPGVWTIFDSAGATRENLNPATWLQPGPNGSPSLVDPNLVFSSSTLGGLETAINVPAGSLTATVNTYNSFITASPPADTAFGKPASALKYQINAPPYYAVWTNLVLHDTCGGVGINANSQVLDVNGIVIQGLYAGGEAAGGLDLIGTEKGIVQGRVAGENAATDQSW
jgi:hypothetical protein